MLQTVNSILHFAKELISVDSSSTIQKVQTKLITNDISLMPVIDNDRKRNTGLIRRKIIWIKMVNNQPIESLENLIEEPLPEINVDETLFDAMSKLKSASAVLIRNQNKEYTHLITPRVVANALEKYAERFKEIELLEHNLRKVLMNLPPTVLKKYEVMFSANLNMMDFSNYTRIFSECWEMLTIKNYDKKLFLKLLNESREYRNALMHFRLEWESKGLESSVKLNRLFKN